MVRTLSPLLAWAALAGATPFGSRAVDSLNEAATEEAHQRDNGATRAFSDVQIKVRTPQKCFVVELGLTDTRGRRRTENAYSLTSSRATSVPT
jgi:hypothetical protein